MLYLIGVLVGIGYWIYYGALLFSRHSDEDIHMAAVVYFALAGIAFVFVGKCNFLVAHYLYYLGQELGRAVN